VRVSCADGGDALLEDWSESEGVRMRVVWLWGEGGGGRSMEFPGRG
jgi:hypothetical protein